MGDFIVCRTCRGRGVEPLPPDDQDQAEQAAERERELTELFERLKESPW